MRRRASPRSSVARSEARSAESTKTSAGGRSAPDAANSRIAPSLPCSSRDPTKTSDCSTSVGATFAVPTSMVMPSRSEAHAISRSVELGRSVAEKKPVVAPRGRAARITSSCAMNDWLGGGCGRLSPGGASSAGGGREAFSTSRSLSASSRMMSSRASNFSFLDLRSVAIFSGVPTIMSALTATAASSPAVSCATSKSTNFKSARASRAICAQSSRVGAMMTQRGVPHAVFFFRMAAAGTRNAPVLPEPVGADTSVSRREMRAGTACIWTAVGSYHSEASSAVRRPLATAASPESAASRLDQDGHGATSSPLETLMRSRLRKLAICCSAAAADAAAASTPPASA
mmetsp:Transcript_14730/g.49412  ORF Transcript_14730/g.49412 Transcript_14730/m.49412 type:complete len:344 (-) Transcript_14730:8-1039(-)